MKDESPDEVIESFDGIRSKCYAFKTKNNVVKKAKGVHNVVVKNKISVDDYNNCVLHDKPKNVMRFCVSGTQVNKLFSSKSVLRTTQERGSGGTRASV